MTTTRICDQHVAILVEHLVVKELGRKHLLLIHCDFSLSHNDAGIFRVHVDINFENSFLQFLNHSHIGLLKVSDA
jgi:hypothetical protein